MATSQKQQTGSKEVVTISRNGVQRGRLGGIFKKPQVGGITLTNPPVGLRFNCKDGYGCIVLPDDTRSGSEGQISILKVARFFGALGMTEAEEWLQVWYILAPTCKLYGVPQNTVCVSYLKTRSLKSFNSVVMRLLAEDTDPAEGIFSFQFVQHSGRNGSYHSLKWDWRERTDDEDEQQQLEQICEFMENVPDSAFLDLDGTRELTNIDDLDPEEIAELVKDGRQQKKAKQLNKAA